MAENRDLVRETLRELGPSVSTELVATLVDEHGLTPAAARQRVSRSRAIKKLAYLKFPRGARFVYLEADYASPQFWQALTDALLRQSISYGGGLAALLARGGMMPVAHFYIACGAPIKQKGHVSAQAVLTQLKRAQLVQIVQVAGVGECVELAHQVEADPYEVATLRARLHTETLLLNAVRDWARKLNLVSYNKVTIRDEADVQPRVGTFEWDLTAPSYLSPLVQWNANRGPKPGFLVCDVLTGVDVSARDLQPFINKCVKLRNLGRVGRSLQLFVADSYQREAFNLAKKNGVIPATPATLFGIEVAEALQQLTDILKSAFPNEDTLRKIDTVFSSLSRIEGAAANLRGALFEFLVAEIVRVTSAYSTVRLNEIVRDQYGTPAEVDVLVHHINHSVRFIECKGYKPGGMLPDKLVERWLKDRIPVIRNAAKSHREWRDCAQRFEFWTTAELSERARQMIANEVHRVRAYEIILVDREELCTRVEQTKNAAIKKTFNEHFRDHPLTEGEPSSERKAARLTIPPDSISVLNMRRRGIPYTEFEDLGEDFLPSEPRRI